MSRNLPKHPHVNYLIALIASYIIWSAAGPVIKLTLEYVPTFTALFFRFLIVCVILLPYVLINLKRDRVLPADYIKIFVLGLLSQTSIFLVFFGIKYSTALESTIISLLGPVLSIAAGIYFYQEKTNSYVKAGIIIATLGTLFVAIEPIFGSHGITPAIEKRLLGNFLVILYNIAFLVYIIWSKISMGQKSLVIRKTLKWIHIKPFKKTYSPIFLTCLTFYVGLISFIPLAFMELAGYFGPVSFDFRSLTYVPVAGIIFLALFSSILAYLLFEWSLTKVEVKDTALYSYLQPIFTLPFAYVLLKELPDIYMTIGCIIIALGVVIAELKKS